MTTSEEITKQHEKRRGEALNVLRSIIFDMSWEGFLKPDPIKIEDGYLKIPIKPADEIIWQEILYNEEEHSDE